MSDSFHDKYVIAQRNVPLFEVAGKTPIRVSLGLLTKLVECSRTIAWLTLVFTCFGLALCLILPRRYKSIVKLMPPKQTQSTTSFFAAGFGTGAFADAAGGGLGLKDPNAPYIGLLKSRTVQEAIVQKFNLMKVYHVKDMTAARKRLGDNTDVVSEKSTFIAITFIDTDKKRAAAIANDYTDELRALTKAISVSEASTRREFFSQQVETAKTGLLSAQMTVQQIEQNKGLVHLDAQANVIIQSLASVRAEIAAKEVELQVQKSYSTERNPEVQLTMQELVSLRKEASRLARNGGGAPAKDPAANQKPDSEDFSDLGLKGVPKQGMEYIRALQDLGFRQSFYDLLLKQYEAASLDEAKEAAVLEVVESGVEADQPDSPKPVHIMSFSILGGFFFSCILGLILQRWDKSKSDPLIAASVEQLRQALRAASFTSKKVSA
jgi:tyrosine-protein kinase Etk/Wzc